MTIVIRIAGVDLTASVLWSSAFFSTQVNGAVGEARLQIRDIAHSLAFTTGDTITLDIDGNRLWGGLLTKASRTYPLSVMPDTTSPRIWSIEGSDWNILFDRRVVRDLSNVDNIFSYAPGTYDDTIINDIYANYLDVSGDGLTTDIHRVAVAIFDIPGVTSGRNTPNAGQAASQGYTWREVMFGIVRNTGAIYFITPDKVFTYVDVDTPDSIYTLTDHPAAATDIGYRSLDLLDDGADMRNDALVWGAGLGSNQIAFARNTSATSVAAHNRWQVGDYDSGIYKTATAAVIASTYVEGSPSSHRGGKDPKEAFVVTVNPAVFLAGQKVTCVSAIFGFTRVLPIRKSEITFPTPDQAVFRLTCSFDPDLPWSMFDYYPFSWKWPVGHWPPIPSTGRTPPGTAVTCRNDQDTFTRVVVFGLGTSEFYLNPPWLSPGTASVDGSQAVIPTGNVPYVGLVMATTTEILTKQTIFRGTTVHGGAPHDVAARLTFLPTNLADLGVRYAELGLLVNHSGPLAGDLQIELQYAYGGSGQTSAVAFTAPGTTFTVWTRFRTEPTSGTGSILKGKVWLDGSTEPGAYQVTLPASWATGGGGSPQPVQPNVLALDNRDGADETIWYVDNIEFIAGRAQVCTTGPAVAASGYVCENATRISGTTYRVTYSFREGLTEVWLSGTRQSDYTEDPVAGEITFGFTVTPSTAEVRVCYTTVGIAAVPIG